MSDVNDSAFANAAKAVKIEEQMRDVASYSKEVNTTANLESILGEALPEFVGAVVVNNLSGGPVHISISGAATSANFAIGTGQSYTLFGSKDRLDLYEFIRPDGAEDISFMVKERVK